MERTIKTVDEYIANCPTEVQGKLGGIRTAINEAAPDATETMEYFQIPGYSYEGYDYNGMFAWFSYVNNAARLHVRPPVLEDHALQLKGYKTTKAIVSFPIGEELPIDLIQELVKASIRVMKEKNPK